MAQREMENAQKQRKKSPKAKPPSNVVFVRAPLQESGFSSDNYSAPEATASSIENVVADDPAPKMLKIQFGSMFTLGDAGG